MLSAMLRLGVGGVQETAYAGGTESGVLCGRRAGARIVAGVLTGGHTRDRLHRAGATHLLGSIAELPDVLADEGGVSGAAPRRPVCRAEHPAVRGRAGLLAADLVVPASAGEGAGGAGEAAAGEAG